MTTTSFIFMLIALILLIIAIGRIQGSPKIGVNLLIALAFGVVVGLGINNKKDSCKSFKNDTKIEKVSHVSYVPIQVLQIMGVTPIIVATNKLVGKVINLQNEDNGDLQQPKIPFNYRTVTISPPYEDSG